MQATDTPIEEIAMVEHWRNAAETWLSAMREHLKDTAELSVDGLDPKAAPPVAAYPSVK